MDSSWGASYTEIRPNHNGCQQCWHNERAKGKSDGLLIPELSTAYMQLINLTACPRTDNGVV